MHALLTQTYATELRLPSTDPLNMRTVGAQLRDLELKSIVDLLFLGKNERQRSDLNEVFCTVCLVKSGVGDFVFR